MRWHVEVLLLMMMFVMIALRAHFGGLLTDLARSANDSHRVLRWPTPAVHLSRGHLLLNCSFIAASWTRFGG